MEDAAPMVSGDLNKNICQECGLPLKVDSYTKINPNTDEEKIILNLNCPNPDHKEMKELNFDEYQALINISMNKQGKCILCNSIQQNRNDSPYYCYTCKKIICSDCLKDKHEKEHKNIVEYKDLKNKCLNHFDDSNKNEIIFYCLICKKNMCQFCVIEDASLDHIKKHNVKNINDLKKDIEQNIMKIQEEQYNNIKQKKILQEKLKNIERKLEFADFSRMRNIIIITYFMIIIRLLILNQMLILRLSKMNKM